jgi:hypothetical protein
VFTPGQPLATLALRTPVGAGKAPPPPPAGTEPGDE